LAKWNIGGAKRGRHVDRHPLPSSRRLDDAGRLNAISACGEFFVMHKRTKRRAIAALFHFAAVGIEDAIAKVGVVALRSFHQQDLVAADAEVAVGDAAALLGVSATVWLTPSNTTKSLPSPCILVKRSLVPVWLFMQSST
jgi:hypothetical protein